MLDIAPLNITERVDEGTLKVVALAATVVSIMPMCIKTWEGGIKGKGDQFICTCRLAAGGSIGFYLFSWHVHEKTVLLPLLPLLFYTALSGGRRNWLKGTVWGAVAGWSNGFLMELDGIMWEYMGIKVMWMGVVGGWGHEIFSDDRRGREKRERYYSIRERVDDVMLVVLPVSCALVSGVSVGVLKLGVLTRIMEKYPDLMELARAAVMFGNAVWGYAWMLTDDMGSCRSSKAKQN